MMFRGPRTVENGQGMRLPHGTRRVSVYDVLAILITLGPLMRPPKLN